VGVALGVTVAVAVVAGLGEEGVSPCARAPGVIQRQKINRLTKSRSPSLERDDRRVRSSLDLHTRITSGGILREERTVFASMTREWSQATDNVKLSFDLETSSGE
jgi:hypothetical protein